MRTIPFLSLLAALSALAGCANAPPSAYVVTLDPSLGSLAENALVATDEWRLAVSALSLTVVMAPCRLQDDPRGTICVMAVPTQPGEASDVEGQTGGGSCGGIGGSSSDRDRCWGIVSVFPPASEHGDAESTRVIVHELGHAMGLSHTGPGTVMCHTSVCASLTVMPADVAQWQSVRR